MSFWSYIKFLDSLVKNRRKSIVSLVKIVSNVEKRERERGLFQIDLAFKSNNSQIQATIIATKRKYHFLNVSLFKSF